VLQKLYQLYHKVLQKLYQLFKGIIRNKNNW